MTEPEIPCAMPSQRECLHRVMGEILAEQGWWSLPESRVVRIATLVSKGSLNPQLAIAEFRALREERGLPPVRQTSVA